MTGQRGSVRGKPTVRKVEATPGWDVRLASLGASAWAELTLQRSGLLSPGVLLVAWALLGGAGLAADRLRTGSGPAIRRGVASGTMAIGLVVCTWGGGFVPAADLGVRLGLVVILAVAANALVQDTIRDLYVGLALTCATLVLSAGLATGASVAVPLVIGVGIVIVCLARLGSARLHGGLVPAAEVPHTVATLGRSVVATLLVGLLAFLLVPHPSGLHTQGRLAAAVRNAVGKPPPDSGGPSTPRSTEGYQGALSLRMRGALPNTPIATVPMDAPQLWRDQIYSGYDGSGWYPTAPEFGKLASPSPGTYVIPAESDSVTDVGTRTDTVRPAAGAPALVFSPGQPTLVRSAEQVSRTAEGSYWFVGSSPGSSYDVTSVGYDALKPASGIAAGHDQGDPTDREWTQLPVTVPDRVVALAQSLAAGAQDRTALVSAIEVYLRTHEKYRLDAPVPALGADAVDAFLFGSHQGFCEQFASAETVLLRAVGVPARVVTGFAYGTPQGNGERLLIASDAHAWVEVYSPGVGWTASDPTAGAAVVVDHPGVGHRFMTWIRHALGSAQGRAILAVLLVLVIGLVLLAGRLVRRFLRRSRRQVPEEQSSRLLAALGRLEAALAADGRPRLPGETLRELGSRLGGEGPLSPSALGAVQALDVLAEATYAPVRPGPPERARAAAALETYAAAVEADVAQKMKGHHGWRSLIRA